MIRETTKGFLFYCDKCKNKEFVPFSRTKDIDTAKQIVIKYGWIINDKDTVCFSCSHKEESE